MIKEEIKLIVQTIYDYQKLRIMVGNRIYALMNKVEEGEDKQEGESNIKDYCTEYIRLSKIVESEGKKPQTILKRNPDSIIKTIFEYQLLEQYHSLLKMEKDNIRILSKFLEQHPLNSFFSKVSGCGPLMSGVILTYFDPYKARHCSSFWAYAGLDVVAGKGRSRIKEHLVERTVVNSEGKEIVYSGLSFSPELKTKLIGVLGSSLMKKENDYRKIYYDYKERKTQENEIKGLGRSKIHIHNMATRYMIKMFLRDLWIEWRTIEGLPVTQPYEVAKLGMNPHGFNY